MENKIKCPKCGNEEAWKAGKPRGKQQYKCKACKRKFTTELSYSTEFKQKAIAIFYEGNSGRAVGRMVGINRPLAKLTELSKFKYQQPKKRR